MGKIEISPTLVRARDLAQQDGHSWGELPAEDMARYFERALTENTPTARFEREVAPGFVIAVDESLSIVLRTPERTVTITNGDRVKDAIDDARAFRDVLEADAEAERRRAL